MDTSRKIKGAIVREYPTIDLEENLQSAIELMAKHNVSALVVMSRGNLIGLVTISDILFCLAHDFLATMHGDHDDFRCLC